MQRDLDIVDPYRKMRLLLKDCSTKQEVQCDYVRLLYCTVHKEAGGVERIWKGSGR